MALIDICWWPLHHTTVGLKYAFVLTISNQNYPYGCWPQGKVCLSTLLLIIQFTYTALTSVTESMDASQIEDAKLVFAR